MKHAKPFPPLPKAARKRAAWVALTGRAPSALGKRRITQTHRNRLRQARLGRHKHPAVFDE